MCCVLLSACSPAQNESWFVGTWVEDKSDSAVAAFCDQVVAEWAGRDSERPAAASEASGAAFRALFPGIPETRGGVRSHARAVLLESTARMEVLAEGVVVREQRGVPPLRARWSMRAGRPVVTTDDGELILFRVQREGDRIWLESQAPPRLRVAWVRQ
jgi:hypothetical protein